MAYHSPTLFFVLPLAISWLVWTAPSQAEAEKVAPAQAGGGEAEAGEPAKANRRGMKRGQRSTAEALEAVWWNDPALVEHLSLSDASRSEMDGYYKASIESHQPGSERERGKAFNDALREGDWEEARKRLQELKANVGGPLVAQGELKISVLSLLNDEQRAKLFERKPELLRGFWPPRRSVASGSRKPPRRPTAE